MHGLCNVKAFLLPCHFDTTIVCLPVSMSALTSDQLCVCSLKYSKLLQTTSCAHMLLNFAYACSVTCSLSECENIFVAHQTILEFFLISELQYGVPWLRVVASSTCIYSLSKTGTLATRYGSLFFSTHYSWPCCFASFWYTLQEDSRNGLMYVLRKCFVAYCDLLHL